MLNLPSGFAFTMFSCLDVCSRLRSTWLCEGLHSLKQPRRGSYDTAAHHTILYPHIMLRCVTRHCINYIFLCYVRVQLEDVRGLGFRVRHKSGEMTQLLQSEEVGRAFREAFCLDSGRLGLGQAFNLVFERSHAQTSMAP